MDKGLAGSAPPIPETLSETDVLRQRAGKGVTVQHENKYRTSHLAVKLFQLHFE
jgi:hypothetical protein